MGVSYEIVSVAILHDDDIHIWPAGIVLSLLPPHCTIGELTTTFVAVIFIWPFDAAFAIASSEPWIRGVVEVAFASVVFHSTKFSLHNGVYFGSPVLN